MNKIEPTKISHYILNWHHFTDKKEITCHAQRCHQKFCCYVVGSILLFICCCCFVKLYIHIGTHSFLKYEIDSSKRLFSFETSLWRIKKYESRQTLPLITRIFGQTSFYGLLKSTKCDYTYYNDLFNGT